MERIRSDEEGSLEELYKVFRRGVRFHLWRQIGPQDLDDTVHDTFLIVAQAIRRGHLREPERLMGFVRTVVRRRVAVCIDETVQSRKCEVSLENGIDVFDNHVDPESAAIRRQRHDLALKILRVISRRDREILTRFYLLEQTQEQICHQMNLTSTQFRLLKSRAKARFGELGRQRLQPQRPV